MNTKVSPELVHSFTSMASNVTIRIIEPDDGAMDAIRAAVAVVEDVAAACTRFDPASPLMRANASPTAWTKVPGVCSDAIREAHAAYLRTQGRFDPRILTSLLRAGYVESQTFSETPELANLNKTVEAHEPPAWLPEFEANRVLLGSEPIDLGGIGKGLAVRWAAEIVREHGSGSLVDAGGDLMTSGLSPEGTPWRIGIENPWDAAGDPVVVQNASDAAVATSSIRLRSWRQGDVARHHLIDPRTGEPGGSGLISVSVIGEDAADAEVWSKALFLEGSENIGRTARERGLAAIWIGTDGYIESSISARQRIEWQVARAA
jgi:thiamine biosynthesis lipoprotein